MKTPRLLLGLLVSVLAVAATAANRYVDANVGVDAENNCLDAARPCRTITHAMGQAAPGAPGDSILVGAGTYGTSLGEVFPISMKAGVRLAAASAQHDAIVDATGANARVFLCVVPGAHTEIAGFVIQGGRAFAASGVIAQGGAIVVDGNSQVRIRRNVFRDNAALGAFGTIGNDGSGARGGAIWSCSGCAPSIENNVFVANRAGGGRGGHNLSGTGGNGGPGQGGAIWHQGSGYIGHNTFYGNHAIGGGGGAGGVQNGNGGSATHGAALTANAFAASNIFVANGASAGSGSTNGTVTYSAMAGSSGAGIVANLFFGNTLNGEPNDFNNTIGSAPIFADPLFHHSPDNLRIGLGSPARGTGFAGTFPSTDFDGVARPDPPSRGAFEASGADFIATDFNDDGRSDILYRNVQTGQVFRFLMDGFTITSGALIHHEPDTSWRVIQEGDFNGDGTTDLLWTHPSGQLYMMPITATGHRGDGSYFYSEPNTSWRVVHTPDIDGDLRADLLWWNASTGRVYAMLMDGPSIVAEGLVYTEPNTHWRIVAVGDFSGSGRRNQVLWRNVATGHVFLMTVAYANGAFSQTGTMVYHEPNTAWKIVTAADFDGDGRFDILWRNEVNGQVYAMLMNGASILAAALVHQEPNLAWKIVAAGDYNGDGKADILWRNDSTGQVFMMLMNGLTISSASLFYQEPNTTWLIMGPGVYATQ